MKPSSLATTQSSSSGNKPPVLPARAVGETARPFDIPPLSLAPNFAGFPIFTAAKLAAVLSCSKRNVLNRLSGLQQRTTLAAGQKAKGYTLAELPSDMTAKLSELRVRFQFRSVEQLVADGLERRWQPLDLKTLHDTEIDRASALKRAMYGPLKMSSSVAGAALVALGMEDYYREFGRRITERHWRRLHDMILTRDAGAGNFDDIRLYVSDDPRLKDTKPQGAFELDFQLDIIQPSLAAIRKVSALTEDELAHIWHCAFQQAEILVLKGLSIRSAKALTLDCISNHGVTLAKTGKALEKSWKRKHVAWSNGGKTSLALNDGRRNNPGRVPLALLTDEERLQVQALVIKTDPNSSKTVITSMALRMYAQTPECRDELREAILKPRCGKHKITSVLKGQAKVTAESKMLARGERSFKLGGHKQPRGLFYIDEAGEEKPILPGVMFESDDMHVNQPFFVPWDDPNDPCAAKFGVRAFRAQLLPSLDVGSGRFTNYAVVLRLTDAYRGSDILWSHLNLFRAVGVPRYLRFERGTWEADTVRRLEACARIHTSVTPGTKFIENRFNELQKVMGLHGVNFGRKRGEFEHTNKDWAAVRAGRLHPEKAGFMSAFKISEALSKSMLWLNAEKMEGEIYKGVPDEMWANHFANHSLPKLTDEQAILLQPERREVSIDAGHVRCRVSEHDATYYFHATDFAKYGTGYKVTVCFDPANPEAGAYVLNRESGSRAYRNAAGVAARMDEKLCWAGHVERVPQFSMASRVEERDSFDRKKRYTEQCRLLFGTIMPFNRGTPVRVAQTNDGRGHVETVEVRGEQITRTEVGAKECATEKLVRAVRVQEQKLQLDRSSVIKNPKRVLEGMDLIQQGLAQLKQEQAENKVVGSSRQ